MSKSEKLCEPHGVDCAARMRREIESDAALIRMVLEDALRGTSPAPHPSGSFEAIKRLEAAALDLVQLSEDMQLAKRCPCKTCELFRLAMPNEPSP